MRLAEMRGIALAIIALFFVTPANAQDAMTTRQIKSLSPRAADRTARSDLLSVFEPVTKIDSGMLRQLRGIGLVTRVFGTEFEGVCERDSVSLRYAPILQGGVPENAPLRPYGVDAQPWFHIITLPKRTPDESASRANVWQTACTSIRSNENVSWFAAKNARTAVQGSLILVEAIEAIRAGLIKSDPCPKIFDAGKVSCENVIIENGDLSKIASVDTCHAASGETCYEIDFETSTTLTIRAHANDDALTPGSLISVGVEQYIVVT